MTRPRVEARVRGQVREQVREQLTGSGLPPVRSVYQPIVDLRTNETIAYEALARGPQGSEFESPPALFGRARDLGTESALDIECQAAAMTGALQGGLPASIPLFVNAEPRFLHTPWPAALAAIRDRASARLQVVVEITERALIDDPAGLLRAVNRIRAAGWGVALDDVGADPASLALMPFIDPDVIKLDLSLIQERTNADIATVVNAVIAQAERSGAIVLAEGIETEEHRDRAMAMGAVLGQGWLLGRPGPLPSRPAAPARSHPAHELTFTRPKHEAPVSPFRLIQEVRPVRTATKGLLLPMSHHLERHTQSTDEASVLLAAFEDAAHFTPATVGRYEQLARRCAFVGALGAGMTDRPAFGVRGADLAPDDQLRGEWVVCVVGPHFSGALIANDLGDDGPDRDRRFDVVITYDRELVLDAARSLFARIAGA